MRALTSQVLNRYRAPIVESLAVFEESGQHPSLLAKARPMVPAFIGLIGVMRVALGRGVRLSCVCVVRVWAVGASACVAVSHPFEVGLRPLLAACLRFRRGARGDAHRFGHRVRFACRVRSHCRLVCCALLSSEIGRWPHARTPFLLA